MLLGSSFAIANELNIYSYRKPFLLKPFLDEYSKKTNIKFNVLHLNRLTIRLSIQVFRLTDSNNNRSHV